MNYMNYPQVLEVYAPGSPRKVLLVWPNYYSPYPPLGLLKLGAYHRNFGDVVSLVRPPYLPEWTPDLILVTSLFTYSWRYVQEAVLFYHCWYPGVPIILGGIYASLMEEHVREHIPGVTYIFKGTISEVDELLPDYSLLQPWMPGWNKSIVFTSRGCIRSCPFCAVPRLEPNFSAFSSVKSFIYPGHEQIILWDNNFLASSFAEDILQELAELRTGRGKRFVVDFNQGLDARLLNIEFARAIAKLRIPVIRLAYDQTVYRKAIREAIQCLKEAKIHLRKVVVYVMYNYMDTPRDFLKRVQELMELGVAVYPMRYQPLDATEKDQYVGKHWTPELLEMVAKARRVLGTHGAWPPHEGLRAKFGRARSLTEALTLRPVVKAETRLAVA